MNRNNIYMGQQPTILEETKFKAVGVDIFSRLMKDRIIFLGDEIDDELANIVTAQLLWLNTIDKKEPIQMYINSPGGFVHSGLQIYDTMQLIKAPVYTICTGNASSMAAILLSGGKKGYRGILPHAKVMIHQPMGGMRGQASDMDIAATQIKKIKNELYDILSDNTGKSVKQIIKDADRDYWMDAKEAVEYGIVDKVFDGKNIL